MHQIFYFEENGLMKKITAFILIFAMIFSMAACDSAGSKDKSPENTPEATVSDTDEPAESTPVPATPGPVLEDGWLRVERNEDGTTVHFTGFPSRVEDFQKVDLKDEYASLAASVLAFILYENHPEWALECLDYLNGPNNVEVSDRQFIETQFSQYPYIARSYLEGASPANDYSGEKSIYIFENDDSRTEDGTVKLWLTSGGADSPRGVTLRLKKSTGEWFLDTYRNMLTAIRLPESDDIWNGKAGSNPMSFDDNILSAEKTENGKIISAAGLPVNIEAYGEIDITDEYKTAAAAVMALAVYETDPDTSVNALGYLMGPAGISVHDKNFVGTQFKECPCVARSYFEGAVPENNYTPVKYSLTITENSHSRDTENFVVLYVSCGGADSPRNITLRKQLSTGCWYVYSFGGLLAGVKTPASEDPWA